MMNAYNFLEAVQLGIEQNNWDMLDDWINNESSFSFNYDTFDDGSIFNEQVFDEIIALLSNETFLYVEGSDNVLRVLKYDWGLLTASQKQRLLPMMTAAFASFRDEFSWFIIAELLGEYYCSQASFDALKKLKTISEDPPRSLVPMGFYQIAKTSSDPKLSRAAHDELIKMRQDRSQEVRDEVELHLAKLNAQNVKTKQKKRS